MVQMILIEGGIAVGKSALCKLLGVSLSNVAIVNTEPVREWVEWNYKGDTYNHLEDFYKNREKEAFNLQTFVQCSLMRNLVAAYERAKIEKKKFIICERSIASSVEIFARMSNDADLISDKQYAILGYWFETLKSLNPEMFKFNTVFYLKCPGETCLNRVRKRGREAEKEISLKYLTEVNEYYEQWRKNDFYPLEKPNCVIKLDGDQDIEYLHDVIQFHLLHL